MTFENFVRAGFDRPLPEPAADAIRGRVLDQRGAFDPSDAALARRSAWPRRLLRSHPRAIAALSFTALALFALAGLALLSTQSLPGDPLYAVKLQVEAARIALTPASFDLRSELARERAAELARLDGLAQLDSARARALIEALNARLLEAQKLSPDERLETLSEELFDRVVPILDERQFAADDPDFPMPLLFRRASGMLRGILEIPSFSWQPAMWGEPGKIYLMVGGKLYKIDSRTMKIVKE